MSDRFYSYDPEDGFAEHDKAEDAAERADEALEACRDQAPDGWPADVDAIHWGRILPLAVIVETRGTQEQDAGARAMGYSHWADYHLAPQPDELAQLRARVAELEAYEVDVNDRFYSYDPVQGFEEHPTAEEAQAGANASLEFTGDYWPEGIDSTEWGRLIPLGRAVEVDRVEAADDPTGEIADLGWDYRCGYKLEPQPDELAQLRAERDALRARVAELEAPPVVPEGWRVYRNIDYWVYDGPATEQAPPILLRALAWAREHDQRPPHAGDERRAQ